MHSLIGLDTKTKTTKITPLSSIEKGVIFRAAINEYTDNNFWQIIAVCESSGKIIFTPEFGYINLGLSPLFYIGNKKNNDTFTTIFLIEEKNLPQKIISGEASFFSAESALTHATNFLEKVFEPEQKILPIASVKQDIGVNFSPTNSQTTVNWANSSTPNTNIKSPKGKKHVSWEPRK
ncbi:hypothetical protein [Curvivirga aplysinae]|uniref:hypothetical protein n=1 Tax=Curvivirga aplysinae TaxID=2529852 RepID=UPI0012BBCBE7|nr:hypothetical protein [Curvivirga aplysinae]MTI08332.1 hypothetical protein [Curvivirga aplysinae]